MQFPDVWEKEIPLHDASRAKTSATPSSLALWAIPPEIVRQKDVIDLLDRDLAAQAAYQMFAGDFDRTRRPGAMEPVGRETGRRTEPS